MKPTRTTTQSRTTTERATQIATMRRALSEVDLSPEEEKVLRLRYGVGEAMHAPIRFRGQEDEQLRVKLAMFERDLLNDAREELSAPEVNANRDRLLDKLRRLGDEV